ncbi:hypothetical protein BY458DRAFT_556842 [Sporodiniella umbellata]|nr:hypothetical protein BY458DRAFT_556842 [Sporodiniella umbellata]
MNFNFEGNYKPKRNINLGGVKSGGDKKSLLLKTQKERKAREELRIKDKSAQQIQAFYRGRQQAAKTRHELRCLFSRLLTETSPQLLTMTRALLLFYQPDKDQEVLLSFVNLVQGQTELLSILKSWKTLSNLFVEKILVRSLCRVECCQLLVSLGASPSVHLMTSVREATMNSIDVLGPFYLEWAKREELLPSLTQCVFSQPFLIDHLQPSLVLDIVSHMQMNIWLETVIAMVGNEEIKEDEKVAGLLINMTEMCHTKQARFLESDKTLVLYIRAIQTLLSHLSINYLVDPVSRSSIGQDTDSSSDSEDDEFGFNNINDGDIEMIEVPHSYSTSKLRERLDLLFETEKVNDILSKCMSLSAPSVDIVRSLSSFINTVLLRWPLKKSTILNTLSYKTSTFHNLLHTLWKSWSRSQEARFFDKNESVLSRTNDAEQLLINPGPNECWSILYLLCEMNARILLTITDTEFFSTESKHYPFSQAEIIQLSLQLKNISFVMFWRAANMSLSHKIGNSGIQLSQLRSTVTHLLQQIHERDSRRSFCSADHWLIPNLNTDNFSSAAVAEEFNLETDLQENIHLSKGRLALISPRLGLLNNIPFVVPFEQRVEIFRQFIQNDRQRNLDDRFGARVKATIRRDHMFEDGFNAFHTLGAGIKDRIAISFVDEFGLEEAGIDGGGVFKEFLTGLSRDAFDLNYGLFVATQEQLLYPNPGSFATESLQLEYFNFLGLIIGKAVYEGILLDSPFASFFLKKCLGKVNHLDDLSSLDPELYKGLLTLKNYDANVEDLSLDFTITQSENGNTVELVPNGSQVPVTNINRIQYIYLVANYRLNVQIAKQCRAFFKGLSTIIDTRWLSMFNEKELQVLLGGASIPIDLDDLRANTVLAGYMEHDATIQNFWKTLELFDNDLRMKFVKFVTSCSRPPLLGFKELVPKFCIRNAGESSERLPTSSTCVNLLKLPDFNSFETLRSKLTYAITADAGFDLS